MPILSQITPGLHYFKSIIGILFFYFFLDHKKQKSIKKISALWSFETFL